MIMEDEELSVLFTQKLEGILALNTQYLSKRGNIGNDERTAHERGKDLVNAVNMQLRATGKEFTLPQKGEPLTVEREAGWAATVQPAIRGKKAHVEATIQSGAFNPLSR